MHCGSPRRRRKRERKKENQKAYLKKKKLNLDWKRYKSGEGNGHLDLESIKDYNKMN